jgi:hypothetical protein
MKTTVSIFAIFVMSMICLSFSNETKHNVLIVGDSISIGYTPFVKDSFGSTVYLEHCRGNAGSSKRGKDSIESWIGERQWDVIVFNFGLHDLVHKDATNKYDVNGKVTLTPEEYRSNLNFIVSKLKETTASLIFVTTTMVPENSSGRKVEDPAIYNKVAIEVMKKNGVEVVDLYTTSLTIHPANSLPGNVHYTAEGYRLLSLPIVEAIKKHLK